MSPNDFVPHFAMLLRSKTLSRDEVKLVPQKLISPASLIEEKSNSLKELFLNTDGAIEVIELPNFMLYMSE